MKQLHKLKRFWRLELAAFFLVASVFLFCSTTSFAVKLYLNDQVYGSYDGTNPVYGGTFRTAWNIPARSFDPHIETAAASATVANLVYSGLLRLGQRMEDIELDLAKSWSQPDDRTYIFNLRKGVRFHDIPPVNGREMTSADVKYSIERLMGKYGKKGKGEFKHNYYFAGKLESIETPDRYTIIFKTKKPYAPFIRYIASSWTMIVPREFVEKHKNLKRKACGTGPFMLKENVKGSHMLFVKHPNYFRRGMPYLDAVHIRIMRDIKTPPAAFIAGKLDGIGLYPWQIGSVQKKVPEADYFEWPNIYTWIVRTPPWIEGKIALEKPFNDRRVRQAIAYALDKRKLLKLSWFAKGEPQIGPIPRTFRPWGLPLKDQWEFNPQKAKRLLAAAGYPNGFTSEMMTWNAGYMTKPMQVIQSMLKDVGINVTLKPLEFAQYFNKAYRYKYKMALHVTTAGYDPSEWLVPYFGKLDTSTYYKWSNPELWRLIEEQEYIMDPVKRLLAVTKIQKMVMQEAMSQSMYVQARLWVNRPYLHHKAYFHPCEAMRYEYSWMDKH